MSKGVKWAPEVPIFNLLGLKTVGRFKTGMPVLNVHGSNS